MASPTGGRFVFSPPSGFSQVVLGINNGTAPVFPGPVNGAFNIEVFTNATVSGVPTPDSGFQASINDRNGTISAGFLTGTNVILGTGNYLMVDSVTGQANQTAAEIVLGSGNQTVVGATQDTLIGGSGVQILSALLGNETVVGGSGDESIWGGANDSIVAGTGGNQQIVVTGSGTTVVAGTAGNATVTTAASDTVTAVSGSQNIVIGAGANNLVDLTGNTGLSAVIGSAGDTITGGSGTTNVEGAAGGMSIGVGAGGTTNISGANSGAGAGNTVLGGSGTLNFNPNSSAGPGTLFQLSESTGTATINAFSFQGTDIDSPDTVFAGNGSDSVWGGAGDRIGTGNGSVVGGTHLWQDADSDSNPVAFGSNDTVSSTTYNVQAHTATRGSDPGTSTANVTVMSFDQTNDFVFYQGESAQTNQKIIATASVSGGNTTILLPDGTEMTFLGVTNPSSIKFG